MGFFWKQISESYGLIGGRGEVIFLCIFCLLLAPLKNKQTDLKWIVERVFQITPPNSQTFPQPPNQTSLELSAVIWNRGKFCRSFFCNTEIQDRKKVFSDEVLETSAATLWWGLVALFALEGSTFPAALIDSNYAVLWIWSWSPDFAGHRDFTVSGKSGVRCLNDSLLPRKSHSGAAVGWQQLWPPYFSFKLLCLAIGEHCSVHGVYSPCAKSCPSYHSFFF